MKLDIERLNNYLREIIERKNEIQKLLNHSDREILEDIWKIKGLKYSIIEISEAMANILQHILANKRGIPVKEYVDTIVKAGKEGIISSELSSKLKPFFDFRNSIVHRYWIISNEKLLILVRENLSDFERFAEEIKTFILKESV